MNGYHKSIIDKNLYAIKGMVYKFVNLKEIKNPDRMKINVIKDELYSKACEVLCDKISLFNEEKGAFTAFAYTLIMPDVKNYYFREICVDRIKNIEFDEDDLENRLDLQELYEIDSDEMSDADLLIGELRTELSKLTEDDRKFLVDIYFNDENIEESGRKNLKMKSFYHHHKNLISDLKFKMNKHKKILENMKKLSDIEYRVLRDYYFLNLSLEEISKKEEIKSNNINELFKTAHYNLKNMGEK